MTTIESNTVRVRNSAEEVFLFLKDMNHFIQLLPQDKVSDWKSTSESCSFRVQGAVVIPLEQVSFTAPNLIHIKSGPSAPFPFTLDINIKSIDEQTCEGNLVFKGEMNAFLRMMAERPLTNLFNFIANKLVEVKSLA
jgi:carbon monoxide dehydrogenase subunit G